jgi:hypothetical protein
MPSKIQVRARDPKIYEFPTNDLMNNHKEGRLFYRSHSTLYLINACPSESVGNGCGCPVTASGLFVCGDISASGLVLTEGSFNETTEVETPAEVDLTGNVTIGTDCTNTLTVNSSATFNCAITASNISASGLIIADNFQSTGDDVAGINFNDDLILLGDLTSSGNISSSGYVTGSVFFASGDLTVLGDTQLGDNCNDDINFKGTVTASCDISSSGIVTGLSGAFDYGLIDDNLIVGGNISALGNIFGDNSTVISGISDLTATGDIQLGDNCNDDINIKGTVTASCDISSSGNIYLDQFLYNRNGVVLQDAFGTQGFGDSSLATNIFGTTITIGPGGGGVPTKITSNLTASGNISGSGLNNIIGGNVTLGDTCSDDINVLGTITSSCDISSSGTITGLTGSFDNLEGILSLIGDATEETGLEIDGYLEVINITASGDISASGDLIVGGDTFLGDSCNDTLTVNATSVFKCDVTFEGAVTSSIISSSIIYSSGSNIFGDDITDTHYFHGNITSSGNISASGGGSVLGGSVTIGDTCNDTLTIDSNVVVNCDITSSGNISASGTITASNISAETFTVIGTDGTLNPTISQEDSDTTGYIVFVGSDPDGTQQPLLGDDSLQYDSSNNILEVPTLQTTQIQFTDGDLAITIADGGGVTFPQDATFTSNVIANGNIIGDGSTNISQINNISASGDITASGNISASGGGSVLGGSVTIGDSCSDVLTVNSSVLVNCDITASGNISASGFITGSNISAENFTIIGDGTLNPSISQEDSDTTCFLVFVGSDPNGTQQPLLGDDSLTYDSNNNILSTPTLQTTQIQFTDGDSAMTIADGGGVTFPQTTTFTSDITANGNITGDNSTNISGINDLTVIGNTSLGNACSDTLTVNAQTTFECPVTASIISASTFTGSFVGDGSGLTGISGGGGNPTIDQSDTATNYVTFVRANPDGSSQQLYGDDDLTFEASDNMLTTNIFSAKDRIQHDGDGDTKIDFDDDEITITVGNEQFIKITEDDTQDKIVFGDQGDIDFIFQGNGTDDLLFLDAAKNKVGFLHQPVNADHQFTINGTTELKAAVSMSNSQVIIGKDVNASTGNGFVTTIINHEDTIDSGDVLKLQVEVASPDETGDLFADFDTIDTAAGTKFIEFYSSTTALGSISLSIGGSLQFDQTSDERKKENIIDTKFKLEDLLKVKIRDFTWKKFKGKDTGVIAQELKEILPHLVGMDSKEEYYTVNYNAFIPLLIKSVQDQQTIISSLEERIKKLEDKK